MKKTSRNCMSHQKLLRLVGYRPSLYERSSEARVIHHKRLGSFIMLAFMITAPVYYAQDHPNGSQLPIEIAEPVRLTVAPSVPPPIAMKVLPNATCALRAEGASDADHSSKLFADDEGTVRFQVHPSAESDQAARFQVDCEAAGQVSRFPLEPELVFNGRDAGARCGGSPVEARSSHAASAHGR
jgi:hypothetical protein